MLQTVAGDYRRKVKTVDELCAAIGSRPRAKKVIMCHGVFDLVHPGHIRHLLYAKEQGRYPGREPDRRRAHHQGAIPPIRAAGAARPQSRGARNGRLRRHRSESDAAREHRAHPARLFRQGLRVRRGGHAIPRPSRSSKSLAGLWRRNSLHAGRHRLLVVAPDRDRAAEHRAREAPAADGGRWPRLRSLATDHREAARASGCMSSATPSSTASPTPR